MFCRLATAVGRRGEFRDASIGASASYNRSTKVDLSSWLKFPDTDDASRSLERERNGLLCVQKFSVNRSVLQLWEA